MSNLYFTIIVIVSLLFAACQNRQCCNNNAIFEEYPAESEEYKNELAEQLRKNNTATYYLNSYEEVDNIPYLYVSVQSDSICANAMVMIRNNDNKLNGIIKNKGLGYNGAELKGLKIDVARDTKKIQFVYRGVDKIID